jgi:hypothetical protein
VVRGDQPLLQVSDRAIRKRNDRHRPAAERMPRRLVAGHMSHSGSGQRPRLLRRAQRVEHAEVVRRDDALIDVSQPGDAVSLMETTRRRPPVELQRLPEIRRLPASHVVGRRQNRGWRRWEHANDLRPRCQGPDEWSEVRTERPAASSSVLKRRGWSNG